MIYEEENPHAVCKVEAIDQLRFFNRMEQNMTCRTTRATPGIHSPTFSGQFLMAFHRSRN